jgi:trypsin
MIMYPRDSFRASKGFALPLALVLFGSAACGAGAPGDTEDISIGHLDERLVGGQLDNQHQAVLAVVASNQATTSLCTGTLIAPNLVLTAQHCVAQINATEVDCSRSRFGARLPAANLVVTPYATLSSRATRFFPVAEVVLPGVGEALCGHDIALLILDGKFDDAGLPALSPRLDLPPTRGEIYTAVGFGDALTEGSPGVRRARAGLSIVCGTRDCGGGGVLNDSEFVGEESVCEGDSGGPALDDDGRVIGVVSRGADECGDAVYSAVAFWRDWMVQTATRAAQLGQYDLPDWAADGAEPIAVAMAAAASADAPEASSETPGAGPAIDSPLEPRSSDGGCSSVPVGSATGHAGGLAALGLGLLAAGTRRRRSRRAA